MDIEAFFSCCIIRLQPEEETAHSGSEAACVIEQLRVCISAVVWQVAVWQ